MTLAAANTSDLDGKGANVERVFLRIRDVEEQYAVKRHTIYRLAKKGKLKIHKLQGTSLIKVSEPTELIESSAA